MSEKKRTPPTLPSSSSPEGGASEPPEPIALDEARQARALADALEGRDAEVDGEALRAAAGIASVREPSLSGAARARIGDELFGPARRHWPLWSAAAAAAGLVIVGGLVARQERAPSATPGYHREAAALVAELMPQPTAAERAQAIAERAAARLPGEVP